MSVSGAATRTESDELQALWLAYHASGGDRGLRDRIVLTLAPLVKFIVYRKVRSVPAHVDAEDFLSVGLEALIHAIDRYDPDKGASLEQFVWTRVHGAVLDELRRQDWAPRSVRRWERDIERACEDFLGIHGRRPTQQELADSLGCSVAELREHRQQIARSDVTSLNAVVMSDGETDIERIDTLPANDDFPDPEHQAMVAVQNDRFRRAFSGLPAREQQIAVLLYVRNLTMAEVGEVMGVSESRICQIHGRTKNRLRAALDDDARFFHLVA